MDFRFYSEVFWMADGSIGVLVELSGRWISWVYNWT